MISNYFKIAIRNLLRNKGFAFINMLGLAIGLTASILILIYINHELSYDRFFSDSGRIYRVAVDGRMSGDFFNAAVGPAPLAPALKANYPEVESAVRIRNMSQEVLLSHSDKKLYMSELLMADSSFFEIFDFASRFGDARAALFEPMSIVLTASTAKKFFGNVNPVGEVLRLNNDFNLLVTAVLEDLPANTHFDFPALISWASITHIQPNYQEDNWGSLAYYTYLKLKENADANLFEAKIEKVIMSKIIIESGEDPEVFENFQMEFNAYLQPLTDIHLYSNLMAEMSPNSDISYIYTFSVIAIFILLIACINFMNLTTARSAKRAKEVGIRKVHGAVRKQLIMQFISESIVLSLITLIISLLLVEIFLPRFGEVVGRELDQSILTDPAMMLKYAALTLFVGFVAGSYPAFYLSSFNPAGVLKGVHFAGNGKTVTLRNVLVVFQFVISIFLIVATGIISDQIEFMQNKRLGFDKERVMIVDLRNQRLRDKVGVLKQELKTIPAVEHVSASTMSPGSGADGSAYFPEGEDNMDPWLIFHAGVDCDYIETMGMTMIRGRNFSKDFFGDTAAVIINRTLWEKTGWGEDVIGKKIKQGDPMNDFGFTVIGVVDDFHFASLHDKVEPFLFYVLKDDMHKLCIRVKDGDMANHLGQIHDAWSRLEPDFPFEYRFLDQSFGELYNAELRLSKMYVYFTIIAIFIACLGLFGLSSYLAEQRTKEIGIRKTFGATAGGLALMLTKDFTRWISLANLIAWPAAYLFMEKWLSQFAFRISLPEHWYVFVYAAILSFLIAVITVSFQAYRAATINPADSLKYE